MARRDNGCSCDGSVIVREFAMEDAYNATKRRTQSYALYRTDGTLRQPLGRLRASEYFGPILFEQSTWRVNGALRELTDAVWDTLITRGCPSDATPVQRRKHISRMKQSVKPAGYPVSWKVRVDQYDRLMRAAARSCFYWVETR